MTLLNHKKLYENEKIIENFTCEAANLYCPNSPTFEKTITYSKSLNSTKLKASNNNKAANFQILQYEMLETKKEAFRK